ncbi:MAG: DUF3516 domain-containing protein, partial [Acidobacteria bacterium]|nr:DUF3516 domain-containing protein [Acidobacteriota bacterium]
MSPTGPLADLGTKPDDDTLLAAFLEWSTDQGLELYPAQEEAILELFAGNNVILKTPTGSGKSLVAFAGHVATIARQGRSWYTAPIKALVSEKFFELSAELGGQNVGMITGDGSVNAAAPVICCTAEILANKALREGTNADVSLVVMDEFHYYSDPQRGTAWQVPLLEMPQAQFLLMSATLGDTDFIQSDLTARTGRPTTVVKSTDRPVPLHFEYRETPIHESIEALLEDGQAPIYIVHFTQRDATDRAQSLTSLGAVNKGEKAAIREEIGHFRFDTPIGKDIKRFLAHGVGVHHAGLLPKYRRLIERLAQKGLLKLICGTDTLGVGVNVPIRTVLFTQLCKYDGTSTRVLGVREFQQIAGRAGRRGFDDIGNVWAQAPAHWIENRQMEAKAAVDPKARKKLVRRKVPERGYAHWNEETFDKLVSGVPEALTSSFATSHQMLMNLLDRPGDGCAATRHLLVDNHEPRARQRKHIRRSISIYRSLLDAGVMEQLYEPDEMGRVVRITVDLQDDFALNQPLSLFALEYIEAMDPADEGYQFDVLSVVEATLESPRAVIAAQRSKARDEAIANWKAEGIEYEERMERLSDVDAPQPLSEELGAAFEIFVGHHPWVGESRPDPKFIARELLETGYTFRDYVTHYGLKRSEGVLLRYLTDAYRALHQTVPSTARTLELNEITEWLGEVIRQTDSSLLEEWEKLQNPDETPQSASSAPAVDERPDVTSNMAAFGVMVRNELFRWVQLLARRDYRGLSERLAEFDQKVEQSVIEEAFTPYFDEHA